MVTNGTDGSELHLDLVEFNCLCILFDEIFEEIQRYDDFLNKSGNVSSYFELNEKNDLEDCLDEFDFAEIDRMIEFYELYSYHCHKEKCTRGYINE